VSPAARALTEGRRASGRAPAGGDGPKNIPAIPFFVHAAVLASKRIGWFVLTLTLVLAVMVVGTAPGSGPPGTRAGLAPAVGPTPAAPSWVVAYPIDATQANVTWLNPPGILTDDLVSVYPGSGCAGSPTVTDLGHVADIFTVGGLTAGLTYSFDVKAANSNGLGPAGTCFTSGAQPFTGTPPAPTDVRVTGTTSPWHFVVTWVNRPDITSEIIYQYVNTPYCYPTGSSSSVNLGGVATSSTWNNASNPNIQSGEPFSFQVADVNASGGGGLSACVNATIGGSPATFTVMDVTTDSFIESWTNGSFTGVSTAYLGFSNESNESCVGNLGGDGVWSWGVYNNGGYVAQAGGFVGYALNTSTTENWTFYPGETVWVDLAIYYTNGHAAVDCQQITFLSTVPIHSGTFDWWIFVALTIFAGTLLYALTQRKRHGEWWG
jgi:hypothetical protein